MCGIIGIASNKPVSSTIINSLRKLEYRGYDSAGIATLSNGIVSEAKSEGRVDILEKNLAVKNMSGPLELDMLDGQRTVFQILLMHTLILQRVYRLYIMGLLKILHF